MDLSKDLKKIIENKSIVLAIAVVLVFLIAGIVLWGGFSSKIVANKNQMSQKKEKTTFIDEYEKAKKELDNYMDSLTKPLTSDALTNKIALLAAQNGIENIDIVPQPAKKFDSYVSTAFAITFSVKKFPDLIAFLQALDASPYSIKIQSWKSRVDNLDMGNISCDLIITSFQVKK